MRPTSDKENVLEWKRLKIVCSEALGCVHEAVVAVCAMTNPYLCHPLRVHGLASLVHERLVDAAVGFALRKARLNMGLRSAEGAVRRSCSRACVVRAHRKEDEGAASFRPHLQVEKWEPGRSTALHVIQVYKNSRHALATADEKWARGWLLQPRAVEVSLVKFAATVTRDLRVLAVLDRLPQEPTDT